MEDSVGLIYMDGLGDVAGYETWRDVAGDEVLHRAVRDSLTLQIVPGPLVLYLNEGREWEMICEIGNSRSGPF